MKECHTSAISIAIIDNYKIDDVYTYGVKRRRTKEEVTPKTLFQAASISKPVFAMAVMRLAEKGKINLDADINTYIRDYTYPTFDGNEHKITLRQFLSHTAGLWTTPTDLAQFGIEIMKALNNKSKLINKIRWSFLAPSMPNVLKY